MEKPVTHSVNASASGLRLWNASLYKFDSFIKVIFCIPPLVRVSVVTTPFSFNLDFASRWFDIPKISHTSAKQKSGSPFSP